MPDLNIPVPLTVGAIEQYKSLTDTERDLLLASQAEEINRYLRSRNIAKSDGRKRQLPAGMEPKTINFSKFTAQDREYLHAVAIATDKTLTHVIRQQVLDFLLQSEDHPDRQERSQRNMHTDKQFYASLNYTVSFHDGVRIAALLSKVPKKREFYEYFSTRIRQLYEELNHDTTN